MFDNLVNKVISYSSNESSVSSKDELRNIRAFVLVWISTTIIMWFYVVFSYWVFDFAIVGCIGLLCTIAHTLSPLIYRKTKSLVLTGLNISLTALVFQVTFCIYNGGIDSPSAIWFTAHPVIISFFASRSLIFFSVFLNMTLVIGLTLLGNLGLFPVDALPIDSTQIMKISSLIGLDIIIAVYTIVFIKTTEQHKNELAQRNKLVEDLMRIITHDVGNALTISVLSTNSIQKYYRKNNQEDPYIQKRLDMILNSNEQIRNISASTLQWMKANDSEIPLTITSVEIGVVPEHLEAAFSPIFENKKIHFEVNSSVNLNTKVLIDENAFKYQIMNNLLSNAAKFSPPDGKITLKIDEVKSTHLQLQVIDEGCGIPKQIIESIFNPAKSTSTIGTGGEKGTGFGMPIVKILIEQMKGSINIHSVEESEDNKKSGTTITITVPLEMV